jgi:hypothetical protein
MNAIDAKDFQILFQKLIQFCKTLINYKSMTMLRSSLRNPLYYFEIYLLLYVQVPYSGFFRLE